MCMDTWALKGVAAKVVLEDYGVLDMVEGQNMIVENK